jgi:hypothetical protein
VQQFLYGVIDIIVSPSHLKKNFFNESAAQILSIISNFGEYANLGLYQLWIRSNEPAQFSDELGTGELEEMLISHAVYI